jgi:hypothetical protein
MTEDEDAIQNSARRSKKRIFEKNIEINDLESPDFDENNRKQNEQASINLKIKS